MSFDDCFGERGLLLGGDEILDAISICSSDPLSAASSVDLILINGLMLGSVLMLSISVPLYKELLVV